MKRKPSVCLALRSLQGLPYGCFYGCFVAALWFLLGSSLRLPITSCFRLYYYWSDNVVYLFLSPYCHFDRLYIFYFKWFCKNVICSLIDWINWFDVIEITNNVRFLALLLLIWQRCIPLSQAICLLFQIICKNVIRSLIDLIN